MVKVNPLSRKGAESCPVSDCTSLCPPVVTCLLPMNLYEAIILSNKQNKEPPVPCGLFKGPISSRLFSPFPICPHPYAQHKTFCFPSGPLSGGTVSEFSFLCVCSPCNGESAPPESLCFLPCISQTEQLSRHL